MIKCEGWGQLPLIPLRKILQLLDVEDAMAAMSTCSHWNCLIREYVGERNPLRLDAGDLEKSLFLTRMFKKKTVKLHIYLTDDENKVNKFMRTIFPMFYNLGPLEELVFTGEKANLFRLNDTPITMRCKATDRLIGAHAQTLKRLLFLGSQALFAGDEEEESDDPDSNELSGQATEDVVEEPIEERVEVIRMPREIEESQRVHGLKHICVDHISVNDHFVKCLSVLEGLARLTINVVHRDTEFEYQEINWDSLYMYHLRKVHLAVNVIGVPFNGLTDLMKTVLVPGMPINSIGVLFCKTVHCQFIKYIGATYQDTLVEFQWVDSQLTQWNPETKKTQGYKGTDSIIHPLISLCWQCSKLMRLVIHGYWIWQYDLLGMTRLRTNTLKHIEVSGTYKTHPVESLTDNDCLFPIVKGQKEQVADSVFIQQMNEFLPNRWAPVSDWNDLHPALLHTATSVEQQSFMRQQILQFPKDVRNN